MANSFGLPNKSGGFMITALEESQIVKRDTKSILKKLLKVFVQTWQEICWQNFQRHQIDTKLILYLINRENLQYQKF